MTNRTDNTTNETAMGLRRLMDVEQVAQYIGLSPHTVYTMVSQRRIPFVKVGRLTRFDPKAVDAWIKRHSVMPTREAM